MSTYTSRVNELEDLVGQPVEREWSELKSWVDLSTASIEARADCARHLAAIANYGGGYVIFGFNNDGTRCTRKNDVRTAYGHDVFAGIIDKYLQPKFQCEVAFPESAGVEHAVVWVPPHGMTPVIAKADGPQDVKGVPQGIRAGTVYVRSPKPESVPATKPEHWENIIKRCVLARRDEMVSMFSAIVTGASSAPRSERDEARRTLATWHKATQAAAIEEAKRVGVDLRYPLAENFVQFSYLVRHRQHDCVPSEQLLAVVEKINKDVREMVRTGWSMFYPFTRAEIRPNFRHDLAVDGGDTDFLQGSTFEAGRMRHGDFWRISADGRASLLRNFHEDTFSTPADVPRQSKWLDPRLQLSDVTEIVRHARGFSEEFSGVTTVDFQLEWQGLAGRVIGSHRANYSLTYSSRESGRIIYQSVPYAEVIGNLPGVVAELFAPVYRVFDPRLNVSAEYVSRLMPTFIETDV